MTPTLHLIFLMLLPLAQPAPVERVSPLAESLPMERSEVGAADAARAQAVRDAVAAVAPSIVTIETIGGAQPVRRGFHGPAEEAFRVGEGPTTGLVLRADGFIITSSFNFVRAPSVVTVLTADGRRFVAQLLGADHIRRIALLHVDATDLPVPHWVLRREIQVGQYAIAAGRGLLAEPLAERVEPLAESLPMERSEVGAADPFVSVGIVSAVERRNGLAVQTDAKVSPINYGGPLLDIEGRVMGILVPMPGAGPALAGAQWYDSGIGFAVYADRIDAVFDRLRAGHDVEPGRIGVGLAPREPEENSFWEQLFPEARGVRITAVAGRSPAHDADLRENDLITALDAHPVGSFQELQRKLSDRAAGEQVTLSIKRRWRKFDVQITLARREDIDDLEPPENENAQPKPEHGGEDAPPDSEPRPD